MKTEEAINIDLDETMFFIWLEQQWKQAEQWRNFVKELLSDDPKLAMFINLTTTDEKTKKKSAIYVKRKSQPNFVPFDVREKIDDINLYEYIEAVWPIKFRLNACQCHLHGHKDKTASFHVYPQTNSFYCFWCARWWSLVDFIMHNNNIEVKEAISFIKTL